MRLVLLSLCFGLWAAMLLAVTTKDATTFLAAFTLLFTGFAWGMALRGSK